MGHNIWIKLFRILTLSTTIIMIRFFESNLQWRIVLIEWARMAIDWSNINMHLFDLRKAFSLFYLEQFIIWFIFLYYRIKIYRLTSFLFANFLYQPFIKFLRTDICITWLSWFIIFFQKQIISSRTLIFNIKL